MNLSPILAALDAERRSLARDGEVIDVRPRVTRMRASDGSHHSVVWSSLSAETADDAIRAEVAHHAALGVGFEWKAYAHDGPPDLLDRLAAHGFDVGPKEAVMVLDVADAAMWPTVANTGVTVARVASAADVDVFRQVAGEVFGKDYGFTAGQLVDALRTGSTQHLGYVASVNGQPAGIGRLYTHPNSAFGGLYGGGTRPDYRGRGVYRAAVAARAADAAKLGARYLLVDALPTSRPILEGMGFVKLTETWPCEWRPAGRSS